MCRNLLVVNLSGKDRVVTKRVRSDNSFQKKDVIVYCLEDYFIIFRGTFILCIILIITVSFLLKERCSIKKLNHFIVLEFKIVKMCSILT